MKSNENPENSGPNRGVTQKSNDNQSKVNTEKQMVQLINISDGKQSTDNSSNSGRNSEKSFSNDSIEFIDIDPSEKMNIKKVVKYKEINEKYIKGEILGQGIFSKVRECIDKQSLKRYAVKIMKKDRLRRMGANVSKNIQKEMHLISKLNHKNVMKMIDSFTTNKKLYIFMEYCAGVLSEILEFAPNHRLPKWQTHHYFCQLIDGLKYLHSMGVYHRDIKDENLLIDNSHVIKIADFGVSFVLNLFAENDTIYGYEGTILYHPPEVLDEEYSGSKFDIWSSGVLLFKMISGYYPFLSNNEDIYDKNSYNNLKYPKVIRKDKQLLDLLKHILNIDFKSRITIKGIKSHPWFRLKHKMGTEVRIDFPAKTFGDIYRGMTLIERLRVKYEYQTPVTTELEFVNQKEYEDSIKPSDPNIRSDRSPTQRQPKQKINPFRRLNRMGILG